MGRAKIISVEVRRGTAGLLHATSPQMRELYVAAGSLDDLRKSILASIEAIFAAHGEAVSVIEAEPKDALVGVEAERADAGLEMPWVIVPKAA